MTKCIAKRAIRVEKAVNSGLIGTTVTVPAAEGDVDEAPLTVVERQEFKPCSFEKLSNFDRIN